MAARAHLQASFNSLPAAAWIAPSTVTHSTHKYLMMDEQSGGYLLPPPPAYMQNPFMSLEQATAVLSDELT